MPLDEELKWYMFKQNKFKKDSLSFEKYKEYWVLTSQSVVEGGRPTIVVPPLRLIPFEDKDQLKETLCEILDEEVAVIPGAVFDDPEFVVDESYKLDALGLKSMRAFNKYSRGFWLKRFDANLHLEEWEKYRGGGYTGTLWSKDFPPDDFEGLVNYLVEKVKDD
ncbi:MAG: hypothetical protein ACKVRN_07505 [Pyrinomonadaceae bacterium]